MADIKKAMDLVSKYQDPIAGNKLDKFDWRSLRDVHEDLQGLPPAWVGVGTLDLFHDEDLAYAKRLREAGVPCELEVVDGAFHGFDVLFPDKPVVKAFFDAQVHALRAARIQSV